MTISRTSAIALKTTFVSHVVTAAKPMQNTYIAGLRKRFLKLNPVGFIVFWFYWFFFGLKS